MNWYHLGKQKRNKNITKLEGKRKKKMKMIAMNEGSQLKSNPFLSVRFTISLIT